MCNEMIGAMESIICEMAKSGYLFKTNNKLRICKPKNGTDYKLREAQKAIGGDIEVVYPIGKWLHDAGVIGIAREDATGCKPNPMASVIFGQIIYGDVIVCMDSMLI